MSEADRNTKVPVSVKNDAYEQGNYERLSGEPVEDDLQDFLDTLETKKAPD